jgi:hypothetical protein
MIHFHWQGRIRYNFKFTTAGEASQLSPGYTCHSFASISDFFAKSAFLKVNQWTQT